METSFECRFGSSHQFSVILAIVLGLSSVALANDTPSAKLYVEHGGIYQVTYELLQDAGVITGAAPSQHMGLRVSGQPVPMWLEDGGDGRYGPGDRFLFVGEPLRGEYSVLDEFSRFACYVLSFSDPAPARADVLDVADLGVPSFRPLATEFHIEQDLLRLRFSQRSVEQREVWYWAKLASVGTDPFGQVLDLRDMDRTRGGHLTIRVSFQGWSNLRSKPDPLKDHSVEVALDGQVLDTAEWDGQESHSIEIEVPVSRIEGDESVISIQVKKRQFPSSGDPVIDVVVLNWIEVRYPWRAEVRSDQSRVVVKPASVASAIRLKSGTDSGDAVVATSGGSYLVTEIARDDEIGFFLPENETTFYVSTVEALLAPDAIALDQPSHLKASTNQADYLMVAHRSLIAAVEPLAELHRERGLTVEVIDVQDVFDEFNHGVVHPESIRRFFEHVWNNWQRPRPRFVLLVGDASWDYKNPTTDDTRYADWTYRPRETFRFVKNTSTPYSEGADLNSRNLVPTWSYPTFEGHAAGDNWFVCLEGDDDVPEMAIGRLPAISAEEVSAVVAKTVAFIEDRPIGPWRRNLLFITNESKGFQSASDRLAERMQAQGYVPLTVYPRPEEKVNEDHTRKIVEDLDNGVSTVHFIGHGGRYIWRTGPPDLKKNHDLFTLEHLDSLAPNPRLPVILSLTCYSAPFDHPSADSIGEKFLRLADRGAIGVFAASWRNSPSPAMGRALLDELTQPGATIGEAIQRAKAAVRNPLFAQTYNLLGDPAVPTVTPRHRLQLERAQPEVPVRVIGHFPSADFDGTVLVEWVSTDGHTVAREQIEVDEPVFEVSLKPDVLPDGSTLAGVRAYMWSEFSGEDGIGWFDLGKEAETVVSAAKDERPSVRRRRRAEGRAVQKEEQR